MSIAEAQLPRDRDIWHLPQGEGHTLIAVLIRYDEEPYYFPDAKAILNALQRNALDMGVKIFPHPTQGHRTSLTAIKWRRY